jgi:hypothetical protein
MKVLQIKDKDQNIKKNNKIKDLVLFYLKTFVKISIVVEESQNSGHNRNIILVFHHTKQGQGFCEIQKQMATTLLSVHRFLPSQSKQISCNFHSEVFCVDLSHKLLHPFEKS